LQQAYDQQQNNHQYGPPPKITTESPHNKLSKPSNKTNLAFVSGPVERLENKTTFTTTSKETDLLDTKSDGGCLSHLNSRSWLEDKRFGNQNRGIDDAYIASSVLNITSLLSDVETNSQNILRHTICAKNSRFLNLKFSSLGEEDGNEQLYRDSDGDGDHDGDTVLTTKNQ
jgi:hypothetical protein